MADFDFGDFISNPFKTMGGLLSSSLPSSYTGTQQVPPSQKGLSGNTAPAINRPFSNLGGLGKAITGHYVSNVGVGQAEENIAQQQKLFEDILGAQRPYDIRGIGGSVEFDEDERTITESLSPEAQTVFDRLLGRAGAEVAIAIDPFEAQQELFEQQQSILEPHQQAQRARSRDIALSRGLDPELSSLGLGHTGSVEDAIARQNQALLASTFGQSQDLLTAQRAREASDIAGAFGLQGMLSGLTGTGVQAGGRSIGNIEGLSDALTTVTDARSARATQRGSSLGNLLGMVGKGLFGGLF